MRECGEHAADVPCFAVEAGSTVGAAGAAGAFLPVLLLVFKQCSTQERFVCTAVLSLLIMV
jgi:hypothetical protein